MEHSPAATSGVSAWGTDVTALTIVVMGTERMSKAVVNILINYITFNYKPYWQTFCVGISCN